MLGSNKVPSGSRITETGAGRKTGWLGNGIGVACNVMWLLRVKEFLLVVQPEAVAGDINGVDVVNILVQVNDMRMDGQRHRQR